MCVCALKWHLFHILQDSISNIFMHLTWWWSSKFSFSFFQFTIIIFLCKKMTSLRPENQIRRSFWNAFAIEATVVRRYSVIWTTFYVIVLQELFITNFNSDIEWNYFPWNKLHRHEHNALHISVGSFRYFWKIPNSIHNKDSTTPHACKLQAHQELLQNFNKNWAESRSWTFFPNENLLSFWDLRRTHQIPPFVPKML